VDSAVVAAAAAGLAAGCALVYWALVITEGAVLGPRVVAYLYDRSAEGYDAIKDIPAGWDEERILAPLVEDLGRWPVRVIDLATGTARGMLLFLADPRFEGEAIGVDSSGGMLSVAWRKVGGWTPRAQLIRSAVAPAPFSSESFDAVLLLEALEFVPEPRQVVQEIGRLTAPGGIVLLTNRVGWEARLMPGRAIPRAALERMLIEAGLQDVRFERWQTHYDLVWARRPGAVEPAGSWLDVVTCPECGQRLRSAGGRLFCPGGHQVVWRGGAWQFGR
jgi:ubiquinone/menaquinone biosynthesis C-methylase UbiE